MLCAALVLLVGVFAEPSTHVVRTRVTSLFGEALPGASVRLSTSDGQALAKATTAGDGTATLPNVRPGRYEVQIDLSGFQRAHYDLEVGEGDVLLEAGLAVAGIVDSPRVTVKGLVRDCGGAPIARATVRARALFDDRMTVRGFTGEDGRYSLTVDEAGQYIITGLVPGRTGAAAIVVLRSVGQSNEVILCLAPPPWLE